MNTQKEIIKALNVKPTILAKKEIRNRIDFLKEYGKKSGAKGFVLGISDSTLDAQKALAFIKPDESLTFNIQDPVPSYGTDHAAEAITGFFTKFGDGGADILPLTGLIKEQGRELLKELNAPEYLYLKTPTADLLDNKPQQADEAELGLPLFLK